MKKIETKLCNYKKQDLETIEDKLNFNCEGLVFSSVLAMTSVLGLAKTTIYSSENKSYDFISKIIENPVYMNPLLYSSLFFIGTSFVFYKQMKKSYEEFRDKFIENEASLRLIFI